MADRLLEHTHRAHLADAATYRAQIIAAAVDRRAELPWPHGDQARRIAEQESDRGR